MICQHCKLKPECNGEVRRTKYGMLCHTHAYQAFLRVRCGLEVHEDSYGAKDKMQGMMFKPDARQQLVDLRRNFLNNLSKLADDVEGSE